MKLTSEEPGLNKCHSSDIPVSTGFHFHINTSDSLRWFPGTMDPEKKTNTFLLQGCAK